MTRSSGTYVPSSGTVAGYKAMWQAISAQLSAVLTRTTDTGQVNWATVTTFPGNGTSRDYEVFKFTDTLQATAPIYVRVDYSGALNSGCTMYVTFGTATNGAGTITGVNTGQLPITSSTPGQLTRTAYASTDGSYVMLLINCQGTAGTGTDGMGGFVIERTRDLDGTPNALGFTKWSWFSSSDAGVAGASYNSGATITAFDPTLPNYGGFFDNNIFTPGLYTATTGLNSGTAVTGVFPAYTAVPVATGIALGGASKALLYGFQNDFVRQSPATISHYGTAMTFLPMGPSAVHNVATMSGVSTAITKILSPLFRWE